jgi:hypothetical protein
MRTNNVPTNRVSESPRQPNRKAMARCRNGAGEADEEIAGERCVPILGIQEQQLVMRFSLFVSRKTFLRFDGQRLDAISAARV